MNWRESLRDVWEQYRWWVLGGLATMAMVAIIGTTLIRASGVTSTGGAVQTRPVVKTGDSEMVATSATTSSRELPSKVVSAGRPAAMQSSHDSGAIVVEVKGAVKTPGVYRFKKDLRVVNAIERAGGLMPDAESKQVNQAMTLRDQMVVYIPAHGEALPSNVGVSAESGSNSTAGTTSPSSAAGSEAPGEAVIGLNSATKEQLTKISGIGDKKAQKILDYRNEHNGYKSLDELKEISGFGEKTIQKLKPHFDLS